MLLNDIVDQCLRLILMLNQILHSSNRLFRRVLKAGWTGVRRRAVFFNMLSLKTIIDFLFWNILFLNGA